MINRRSSVYYQLPEVLTSGSKTKEAKATLSINLVVPKEFERKSEKFVAEQTDLFAKAFKKWVKRQVEKELDK